MTFPTNDPAHLSFPRFVREFMARHWDGCVVIAAFGVNWSAAVVCALMIWLHLGANAVSWVHVLLFGALPVVGFVWFLRDSVNWRSGLQIAVSVAFQIFLAALPWIVLIQSLIRRAGLD
ncbi:MAG: hypothetical protein K2X63_03100 [Burkholderiaceae bacterium]|nr:hypothetical protein [Burkholderiaceae bacterium]